MAVNLHITGHGGTTRKVAGALLVLLSHLVHATAFSTARSSTFARRGLLDSPDMPRTIAVELMHVHHVDSPYMQGQRNLTLTERVQLSVANSKRRLPTTDVFTSPLQAAAGEYIVQITVGTPARKFVAIADTGSDLVWLQCSDSTCVDTDCIQIRDLPFNPDKSSSYAPLPCNAVFCTDLTFDELPCPLTNMMKRKQRLGPKFGPFPTYKSLRSYSGNGRSPAEKGKLTIVTMCPI